MMNTQNQQQLKVRVYVLWYLTFIGLITVVPFVNPVQKEECTPFECICPNIDVRNTAANLHKLENCTVIEGSLQILLIDNGRPEDYESYSFPKLREITDFVLLYRAFGLRTLSKLFPNLSVIRGAKLFHNYALVVYEMMNLEEIALPSLTDILRGSVLITKNPQMCFVDSVDWDLIAKRGKGEHFIKNNKDSNLCPSDCHSSCPLRRNSDKQNARLCWNQETCQKVCHNSCGQNACSETSSSFCCSDQCLGGCTESKGSADCFVCSNVVYNNKCSKTCPPHTYEFAERRCVTDFECKDKENWVVSDQEKCLSECPPGYMEKKNENNTCERCIGSCPKACKGILVDSAADAQELKGCTRITGSLEIQISGGGNIVQELEENLNMIEEVDDYVKVVRSYPLISLNFLKNLRKIHGKSKENDGYSLLVYDNDNLQEIMDFRNRKVPLEIVSGKIFFHLNPKLCLSKIKELKKFANLPDWDNKDVSATSNGDQMPCDVKLMNATVKTVKPNSVELLWENVQKTVGDHRNILGYIISFKEAQFRNVTIFDGRDACGGDTWKVIDVTASNSEGSVEQSFLTGLKPFTQYAVYIRTYVVRTEDEGAQSDILYFRTLPDHPSIVQDLKATSNNPNELELSWKPPLRPNGIVHHYTVIGTLIKQTRLNIDRRDYCKQHLITDTKQDTTKNDLVPSTEKSVPDLDICPGTKEKVDLKIVAEEAQFENMFEDMIHNRVYIKRPDAVIRKKRSVDKYTEQLNNASYVNDTSPSVESPVQLAFNLMSITDTRIITNLTHFSDYEIEVKACHKIDSTGKQLCSTKAITTARTAALAHADDLTHGTISLQVQNDTNVKIKWREPQYPNGLVVAYEVEYSRTNVHNYKPITECINHTHYRNHRGHTLTGLLPGNYKVRIRTYTLAGFGNWTEFILFDIADTKGGLSVGTVAAIATCAIILVIICLGLSLYFVFRKKYGQNIPNRVLYASVNPEYMTTGVYIPDEWEVPRDKITILKELGQGSFGMVYAGIAKGIVKGEPETKCAIKTVNESASVRERIEFLNEASVMKAFTSFHVLKLLGVVSKGQPTLVVMELMTNGDLKAYLRSLRPDIDDTQNTTGHPPTLDTVLRMASEIADGMAYLSAKKFVHRDLAARNCMVGDGLIVKIGDFGMTRDVYETDYYRKGGKGLLPVRWMAPESLKDGVFTSLSDAWSYGVVLWEMATLASQPYQGLSNEQVLKYVIDGGVMERPEACPDKLYDLMRRCWQQNPKYRPTFIQLVKDLLSYVRPNFDKSSFYFSQEAERLFITPDVDIDNISPSTPLRSSSHDVTQITNDDEGNAESGGGGGWSKTFSVHSNESSKGLSSDGSGESKLSTHSANGGLVNGHHQLPVV